MEGAIPVEEAAQRYGVSGRMLWRLHRQGLLPLYKEVGVRSTLVKLAELEQALTDRRRPGRPRKTDAGSYKPQ